MFGFGKAQKFVCRHCGTSSEGKLIKRGSPLLELTLWLFFGWCLFTDDKISTEAGTLGGSFVIPLILALTCSVYRASKTWKVCTKCGSAELVPLDTPAGQKLVAEYGQGQKVSQK